MASTAIATETPSPVSFETHPDRYRHWRFRVEGDIARLTMAVDLHGGLRPGYELKLNSYDLGVDIELADAIQRLRFEHPQVRCLVIDGALEKVFCAGANISMLRTSSHAWKVNFCKFTNETRLYLEDLSAHSGVRTLAACNGTTAGGGYELALACDQILLVDDRASAVSLPELSLLAVLPGTGGLTRLVDKRKLRRDLADVFSTLAGGVKAEKALEWGLVDAIAPLSRFGAAREQMARALAESVPDKSARSGVPLPPLRPTESARRVEYRYVTLELNPERHVASLSLRVADQFQPPAGAGAEWWPLRAFRELDDALLRLRVNHPDINLVALRAEGDPALALAYDRALIEQHDEWFVAEVRLFIRRVLKRLETSAKSLFALAGRGSAFAGTLLELALAADRVYVLDDPGVEVRLGVSALNGGAYPMGNGLSRLQTRFLREPQRVGAVLARAGLIPASDAAELGLATFALDAIDWEDELRVAMEERASFSPDALTGMEANLRFAGPETLETKIFGRLSAWQNWIFQRPNAVGPNGALQCYGTPSRPEFDYFRT
ncbi:MAG: benzoyl-CoA-dihydrodiol lyase [Planctomycetota bacterium]|nr:MAG: benzoyl-CoA-dihydrodiol lyase [Planctomycetota bacterium]